MSISPPGVELVGSKDLYGRNITFIETAKYIPFRAQRCQKYASQPKNLQIKVARRWNFVQKSPRRYMSISPMEWS